MDNPGILNVNLTMTYLGLDGKVLKSDGKTEDNIREIFKMALANEFSSDSQGDTDLVIKRRLMCGDLIAKLRTTSPSVSFTAEEVILLKERVARSWSSLYSGPTLRVLTGLKPYDEAVNVVGP